MMLQAIQFGILDTDDDEKPEFLRNAILFQGLLFVWWLINFSIINALGPDLSGGMIFMEVLYALVTLWFFAVISLKSIDLKKYLMLLNPLVSLIGPVVVSFILMFVGFKY